MPQAVTGRAVVAKKDPAPKAKGNRREEEASSEAINEAIAPKVGLAGPGVRAEPESSPNSKHVSGEQGNGEGMRADNK